MKHYAGLDVSVKETAICIVDENGRICREAKVVSHPEDLSKALTETGFRIERIGLEAGPLSQWLFEGMARDGLLVICVETRHTKAFLKAQINKSDRNDARGIAQMMRVNLLDLPGKCGEHQLRNQEVFYGKREQTDAGVSA